MRDSIELFGTTDKSDRGVAPVIGFVLIIMLLLIANSVYYNNFVISQNKESQFEHRQDVRQDVIKFTSNIPSGNAELGHKIKYSNGFIGFLSTSGGILKIQTTDKYQIHLQGIKSEGNLYYDSRILSIETEYRYGQEPAWFVEYGMAFERGEENGYVALTPENIVDNENITLYTFKDKINRQQYHTIMYMEKNITADKTIQNSDGKNIKITLPTNIPEKTWREALEEELVSNGGKIKSISYEKNSDSINRVTIALEQGTYNLKVIEVDMTVGI